jgi:hypothetical protein
LNAPGGIPSPVPRKVNQERPKAMSVTNPRVALKALPTKLREAYIQKHPTFQNRFAAIYECLRQTNELEASAFEIHNATMAAMNVLTAKHLTNVTQAEMSAYYQKVRHAQEMRWDAENALRRIALGGVE